jgi:hypothetical protein
MSKLQPFTCVKKNFNSTSRYVPGRRPGSDKPSARRQALLATGSFVLLKKKPLDASIKGPI